MSGIRTSCEDIVVITSMLGHNVMMEKHDRRKETESLSKSNQEFVNIQETTVKSISFKINELMFNIYFGFSPVYTSLLVTSCSESHSRRKLRLAAKGDSVVPRYYKITLGT